MELEVVLDLGQPVHQDHPHVGGDVAGLEVVLGDDEGFLNAPEVLEGFPAVLVQVFVNFYV